MFLAYNRPINTKLIEAKAELTAEALKTLKTSYIKAFFEHARQTEATLPTDGTLKKIFVANVQKFSDVENTVQIEYSFESPDEDWKARFHVEVKRVIAGISTASESKARLGL